MIEVTALIEPHRTIPTLELDDWQDGNWGDGNALVAIMGERGSGKTTLLASVCRRLTDSGNVVLPVIRPEIFASTDSLISVALASAEVLVGRRAAVRTTEDVESVPANGSVTQDLDLTIRDAIQGAMLHSPQAASLLRDSGIGLSQYSSDLGVILRHSSELHGLLSRAFVALRAHLVPNRPSALIVPVDDADLVPANLPSVLADLRLLSSVSSVVPIMCVNEQDLRAHLLSALESRSLTTFGPTASRMVHRQLQKTIPPDQRIEPPHIDHADRLAFIPLGEDLSIRHAFSTLAKLVEERTGLVFRLARLLSHTSIPAVDTGVLAWLPDTPRALEHIWVTLWRLNAALRALNEASLHEVAATKLVLADSLRRFIATIAGDHPDLETRFDTTSDAEPPEENSDRLSGGILRASAGWPESGTGAAALGPWKAVVDVPGLRVEFRRFARVTGSVKIEQRRSADAPQSRSLSESELHTLLVTQEFLESPLFAMPRPGAPFFTGESEYAWLQQVRINGLKTDDRFFLLPRARGIVQNGRSRYLWNSMFGSLRRDRTEAAGEKLVALLLEAVRKTWTTGEVFPDPARSRSIEEEMELCCNSYLSTGGLLGSGLEEDSSDAAAYSDWFEVRLPAMMHEAIVPEPQLTAAIELWLATVGTGPRRAESVSALEQDFVERFEAADLNRPTPPPRAAWLAGYARLFEFVSSPLAASVAGLRRDYDNRTRPRDLAHDYLRSSMEITTVAERYEFSPEVTPESAAEFDTVMRVLDQLRT